MVNSGSVRCQLLDGPCKGEELKRNYKQFRLMDQAQKQATVPPAGTANSAGSSSGAAPQSVDRDEVAAKKLKAAERAQGLFGDNNDVQDD